MKIRYIEPKPRGATIYEIANLPKLGLPLLAAIALVLARHGINLQLAKISTLGERVEDTFLVDGEALQQNKVQLQIENELLDAIALPA